MLGRRRRHWDVRSFNHLRLLDGDVPATAAIELHVILRPGGLWSVQVRHPEDSYWTEIRGDQSVSASRAFDEIFGIAFRVPRRSRFN